MKINVITINNNETVMTVECDKSEILVHQKSDDLDLHIPINKSQYDLLDSFGFKVIFVSSLTSYCSTKNDSDYPKYYAVLSVSDLKLVERLDFVNNLLNLISFDVTFTPTHIWGHNG